MAAAAAAASQAMREVGEACCFVLLKMRECDRNDSLTPKVSSLMFFYSI